MVLSLTALTQCAGQRDSETQEVTKTNNNTSAKWLFAKIVCLRSFYARKKMVATAIEMWKFSTFGKTLEKGTSYCNDDKAC